MPKKNDIHGKSPARALTRSEYKALADFRYQIRSYLRYMEEKARARGYNPQQYQLLLRLKGCPKERCPRSRRWPNGCSLTTIDGGISGSL